jgi:hypothetical protein
MYITHASVDLTLFRTLAKRTVETLGDGTTRAVSRAVSEGASFARTHHIHKRRTGFLTSPAQLHGKLIRSDGRSALGEIVNLASYARWVEERTKPHWIRPKEGHGFIGPLQAGQSRRAITDIGTHRVALRWYVGGKPVFARAVFHPGTPAMPFMYPGALYARDVMMQSLQERLRMVERSIWN